MAIALKNEDVDDELCRVQPRLTIKAARVAQSRGWAGPGAVDRESTSRWEVEGVLRCDNIRREASYTSTTQAPSIRRWSCTTCKLVTT